jgi:Tfp pilus assembly protein PilF
VASPFHLFRLALPLLLVTACASPGPGDTGSAPVGTTAPDYTSVEPPPREAPATAAYQPLLDRAAEARQRGDYEQALALLERAQRIDADSAEIYLALARTHSERGDVGQARAVAERGLLYCRNSRQCDALRAFAR